MATIEKEFLKRSNPRTGDFKAPPFIPRIKQVDIGLEKLDGKRYYSPEFMQAESGFMDTFTCPFHGWKWEIDGSLEKVAAPEFFRQFEDGVPADELALQPVKRFAYAISTRR